MLTCINYYVVKRLLLFSAFPLAYTLLCNSCGDGANTDSDKQVFRYNEIANITSLDPAAANNLENIWAVNQLYNGLVQLDDSLNILPCLAHSWDVSDSGRRYTFHIRSDVFFHDHELFPDGKGRKMVAGDFERTFRRLYLHKSDQSAKFIFAKLKVNAKLEEFGCDAPDDSTFILFLNKPFPPLLGILTMQFFSVVPVEIADHYDEQFRVHPVGTGPFRLKVWEEDVKLVMVKNENYFEFDNSRRLPFLDAVSVSFVRDKESMMIEFFAGRLDMISGADAINMKKVFSDDGALLPELRDSFQLQKSRFLKTDYMGFLVDKELEVTKGNPLLDKRVRQAMNYAIDRDKIIRDLRQNIGYPASSGFVPVGMPSYSDQVVRGYSYDPEKAKKLLKQAGYAGGMPEIIMQVTPNYQLMSELMAAQLEEVGFEIKINVNQPIVLREEVESSRFLFFRKTWVADYADAESFLSIFYSPNFSPNGSNYFHFRSAEFDRLYEEAMTMNDPEERYVLYRRMDKIIMEEAVVIPLYYDEVVRLVGKDVHNLTPNGMNLLNLKKVSMKRSHS